jgi:uncharacterized protein (TIGR02596 family)
MKTTAHPARPRGFTLVEVLVVLALIGMLMFFTVPGLKDVFRGSKITTTADQIADDMSIARQVAVKENVPVEVRFFKYPDPNNLGEERFSAYQCYRLKQDLNTPSDYTTKRIAVPIFEKMRYIPQGVVVLDSVEWSTILTDSKIRSDNDIVKGLIPGEKETQASFRSFIITAEGETSLDRTGVKQWFLTMVNEQELKKASGVESIKPANFITLLIDPYTAGVRRYQPN